MTAIARNDREISQAVARQLAENGYSWGQLELRLGEHGDGVYWFFPARHANSYASPPTLAPPGTRAGSGRLVRGDEVRAWVWMPGEPPDPRFQANMRDGQTPGPAGLPWGPVLLAAGGIAALVVIGMARR
jgi:hypothetical protein